MDQKPILFREPNAGRDTPPLILFFEEKAVKDERASRAGPAIYDRVTYVKVVVAGSKGDAPIYEIERKKEDGFTKRDQHTYARFGKPFEEWRAGRESAPVGTPLEQWPLMDIVLVAKFKDSHIYTVQQLAETSDGALSTIRQGGEWKAKAKRWLGDAKEAAGDVQARADLAEANKRIDELQAQVRELLKKQNTVGFDKGKKGSAKRQVSDDDLIPIDMLDDEDQAQAGGYRL